MQLIDKMPNLEVISLSVNKINSLKDFAKCSKLHVSNPPPRNFIFAKTASPISGKSDIYSTSHIWNPSGFTIIHALNTKTIDRLFCITCPISPNLIIMLLPASKRQQLLVRNMILILVAWRNKSKVMCRSLQRKVILIKVRLKECVPIQKYIGKRDQVTNTDIVEVVTNKFRIQTKMNPTWKIWLATKIFWLQCYLCWSSWIVEVLRLLEKKLKNS